MSDDAEITRALASALGLTVDEQALAAVYDDFDATLTEWSVNPGRNPRGALRLGAWTEHDYPAVARSLEALGAQNGLGFRDGLPYEGQIEGVGLAVGDDAVARPRWWVLGPPGDGTALADALAAQSPQFAAEIDRLAALCGGRARCTGAGFEGGPEGARRHTVYFTIQQPQIAVALLESLGVEVTAGASRFFRVLLGMDPSAERVWPKVWVGRSLGVGGGHKFYYFARGAEQRPPDEALIDLAGGSGAAYAAWHALRKHVTPEEREAGLVQLVGLTFRDGNPPDAEPEWTVYLARR